MPGVRLAAEPYAPPYVVAAPPPPAHAIDRPAALDELDSAVGANRVVLVIAPAGYGKTTTLSAWAARSARPLAWLSLTAADKHPQRLERGLLTALEPLWRTGAARLEDLLQHALPPHPAGDPVLVLDDVHLLGPAASGVLGTLVERAPAGLRIVLSSRSRPLLRLQRINVAGGLGEVSIDRLAFSAEEVRLAAARLDRPLSEDQATRLLGLTAGWPVAVRLALLSGPEPSGRLATGGQLRLATLTDYLIEEILGDLPPVLRDLLLELSVSDWLTGRLAIELSGDELAPAMLDDAISRGLPLERRGDFRGEPVYRWHPLVAEQCRVLLQRRDPRLADRLHLRAARFLASTDPALAARHALSGRSPELAAEIILGHWLGSVLHGDFAVLEDICRQLPHPWSENPDIVSVLAACRSADDDPVRAAELRRRAGLLALAGGPEARERHRVTELLSDLLVADDADTLVRTCEQVREVLTDTTLLHGAERACAWFLVAFADVRLRRGTAVGALREAAALSRAEGLDDLAERAVANLVFALAFAGDFAASEALLAESAGDENARWRRTEGSPESFAVGWISLWRDDPDRAAEFFRRCIAAGGAMTSFATMARIWSASVAADSDDPVIVRQAEAALDEVRNTTVQGVPLNVYRGMARAQLALAAGRPDAAAAILDEVLPGADNIPATLAFAAETYLSCHRPDAARSCLDALHTVDSVPSYVTVAALVVEALLVVDRAGAEDGQAEQVHALVERALALASPGRVLHPFVRADPRLPVIMAAHAQRGSAHEEMLAAVLGRIAERRADARPVPGLTLSSREREVLGYLQTGLSTAEIADALFISLNTLKTHQRSIYRKLGVASRREAIKASRDPRLRASG